MLVSWILSSTPPTLTLLLRWGPAFPMRPCTDPATPSSLTLLLLSYKPDPPLPSFWSVKKTNKQKDKCSSSKAHGSLKAWENPKKKHPWESPVVYLGGAIVWPALRLPPRRWPSCYPSSLPPPCHASDEFSFSSTTCSCLWVRHLAWGLDPAHMLTSELSSLLLPQFLPWHWPMEAGTPPHTRAHTHTLSHSC